jgi:hypothetical protein
MAYVIVIIIVSTHPPSLFLPLGFCSAPPTNQIAGGGRKRDPAQHRHEPYFRRVFSRVYEFRVEAVWRFE